MKTQTELAEKLEKELSAKYDVLYDDRKMNDQVLNLMMLT